MLTRSPRWTGPDDETRMKVLWRDAHECVRCGEFLHERRPHQIHHRRPRGMGGTDRADANSMPNLLSLCLDCHAHIESHRAEAFRNGWLVHQRTNPALVAVLIERESKWVYLNDVDWSDDPPEVVL